MRPVQLFLTCPPLSVLFRRISHFGFATSLMKDFPPVTTQKPLCNKTGLKQLVDEQKIAYLSPSHISE